MNFRKVRLIFVRELRDQLRDRRTLFMVLVLPILLYPALGIGMLQMVVVFRESPRTVVILGTSSLPAPSLIADGRFSERWFSDPLDASRLLVETDETSSEPPVVASRLLAARHAAALYKHRPLLDNTGNQQQSRPPLTTAHKIDEQITALLRKAGIDVLIVIPSGFADNLAKVDQLIAAHQAVPEEPHYARPVILVSGDEDSLVASRQVQQVFAAWEAELLRLRLAAAGLPDSLPTPVNASVVRVASHHQQSAIVWSKLYPAILVLMTVTGAFYPAVDLAAGEKERGTMETLLISPARRLELVAAKFLTVLVFSLVTALLNLVSLGLTAAYMVTLVGEASAQATLTPPSTTGLAWVLLLLIPLAAFFSALCLALATFARSNREGQYYLSPLMIIVMMVCALAASPGIELRPFHTVLPVVGPVLLLKQVLADPTRGDAMLYVAPVLLSSFTYAALALWWAVTQFQNEQVLFREAERLDLRLWLRRLWTHKPDIPGAGGAVCCLSVALLGQLFLMKPLGNWLSTASDPPKTALLMLIAQQVLLFLLPAALLGLLLLRNPRRTFRLQRCGFAAILVAAALALTLHAPVLELMARLQWFFPPGLPEGSQAYLEEMLGPSQPLLLVLAAAALAPAVCEEFLFRGYVLSALDRPGRRGLAVVLSSLAFGGLHMIPQQVFYATLLGLVLGLLVIRTGSLWPGLVFHFSFNALSVLSKRLSLPATPARHLEWLVSIETVKGENTLRYDWPLLIISAIVAAWLLHRALKLTGTADEAARAVSHSSSPPAAS